MNGNHRRRYAAGLLGFALIATMTAGCSLNPAADAEAALEAHLREQFPEAIVEISAQRNNSLPFMGELYAIAVLTDGTPQDVLLEVYQEVMDYPAPSRVGYTPVGVEANGLGICANDAMQEEKLALRAALLQAETSLTGRWACAPYGTTNHHNYRGDLEQFIVDTTTIQTLSPADGTAIELDATLTMMLPNGARVTGTAVGLWSEIEGHQQLEAAIDAVAEHAAPRNFAIEGSTLRIAVQPTHHTEQAQEHAQEQVGDVLTIEVVQGSVDPTEQARYERLAPAADALRGVDGVRTVSANNAGVTVVTTEPATAEAVLDTWRQHPEVEVDTRLHIQVERPGPDGSRALSRYEHQPGSGYRLFDTFMALLEVDGFETVGVTDYADADLSRVTLRLETDRLDAVTAAKPLIPTGTTVMIFGATERGGAEFVAADQLGSGDVSISLSSEPLDALIDAWNAG